MKPSNGHRPLQPVQALQARRALDAAVLATEPTVGTLRVWAVVANYTLGYGKTQDALTHGRIAAEARVGPETVRRALRCLCQAEVIAYRAGHGDAAQGRNTFSRIAVKVPSEVLGGTPPASGDPSSERGGTPLAGGEGPLQQEGSGPQRPEERDPSSQRGNRERATEGGLARERTSAEDSRGVVARSSCPTTAREEEPSAPVFDGEVVQDQPSPAAPADGCSLVLAGQTGQDQEQTTRQIVFELAAACRESGHPLTRPPADLLPGVRAALAAGYSPESVLVGLGFWRAEGFISPKQIGEMTERAAVRGGPPPPGASRAELLAEGAHRFAQPPTRRTEKQAREARNKAALAAWSRSEERRTLR